MAFGNTQATRKPVFVTQFMNLLRAHTRPSSSSDVLDRALISSTKKFKSVSLLEMPKDLSPVLSNLKSLSSNL